MKRILTLCVAALVSTNAFASQSRQEVLGTLDPLNVVSSGLHGSMMVDDNLNMFYNPAYVNDFRNWASIEKTDEGGFVTSLGPINLGFYMNRAGATDSFLHTPSTYVSAPARPFDVIIGGDMGWKWGLGFTYGSNKNSDAATQGTTEMSLRAGISVMDFEPFMNFVLMGRDKEAGTGTSTAELKNKSMSFGLRYKYGEWAPFAVYRMDGHERSGDTTAAANYTDRDSKAFGFGVARNTKIADMVTLNYGVAYWVKTALTAPTTSNQRSTNQVLPISISAEGEAASWLVIRGGFTYKLVNTTQGLSNADDTEARFGAGFKLGKAMLDWSVGGAAGTADDQFGFSDKTFTTASLTYSW